MVRASLVVFAVAFLAGIVAVASGYALTVMAAALGIAALPGSVPRATRAGALFALVAGMTEAAIAGHVATPLADTHVLRLAADVTAVQEEPGGLISTTLRFADSTSGTATLSGVPLPIGARVVIRGSRVPFDEARNPGEPSQRDIMAERGITWRVVHARVLSSSPPDPNDPTLWIPRARAWASSQVHARFPEPEATILAGAMWGERGTLAPDLKDEFQETGTVHVLVTAGLHLGVIAAFTVVLLEALGCGRILSSLVAIACVWAYAALSGDHLPSVRAATMLSFALVARAAGREPFSWNALALAAIVVAALRPASVTSVSFALSFSCVAAIFAFAKPIASALEEFGVPHVVREALAVAFATQLGTWPLTVSAFLVIAPYAPLANALVVPIVGIALLGGFATLALGAIPPLANVAATIETSLVDWIVAVVRFVASLPGAHVVATPPPNWTIAVYDGALALAAFWISNGRSKRATLFIFAGAALCLWPPRTPAHGVTITAIDVGQADAILIRTPRGHAYLVDAGGRLESGLQQGGASQAETIGARIVVPFLIRQGIHHLDAVLLSHPHGEHKGFKAHYQNRPGMASGIWAYCRVSTKKDEQELSLEEQERWSRTYAGTTGEEITIFREHASAKSTIGRPEFQRMMASLQELPAGKRPRSIIATSLDRLSRDMTDTLLVVRTLRALKVPLFIRDVGAINSDTFAQRAALVGQSMGGEAENEARSARARASWDRRRREGKPTSNKVPYGLQLENERDVPAPDSSHWVRMAFEWYMAGLGSKTIAERFKANAPPHTVRTRYAGNDGQPIYRSRHHVWEYNRILKLLRQPRYRGTIVEADLYDGVQNLLASKPRWRQTRKGEYPLSGAVKCAGCNRSLSGHSVGGERRKRLASGELKSYGVFRTRYYQCKLCLVQINADRMERRFREDVGALIGDEHLLRRWVAGERSNTNANAVRREIAAIERVASEEAIEAARSHAWQLALGSPHAAADLDRQLARISTKAEADRARLRELRAVLQRGENAKRTVEQAQNLLANFWTRYDRASYEQKRELMGALTAALGGCSATKYGLIWPRRPDQALATA